MTAPLVLIDYGAGNLRSVANALHAAGVKELAVTRDPDQVARADRIVLPGVGAFAHCMDALRAVDGMIAAMTLAVRDRGTPFLGICVGMQLLADVGEEHGETKGLGWIAGRVRAIPPAPALRVPHMGWNDVVPAAPHPLIVAGEGYFLHGYHFAAADPAHVIATSDHGGPLVAAVAEGPVAGVQFHPEKSQGFGLALLEGFLRWTP